MILNAAIMNGALEIMPHTLATMAIVPLQMRLVYKVGHAYGFELDRGHIKDFLATVGVGLTSQVFEGFTRQLVSGLSRRLVGGLVGGLLGEATGSAVAFASTYAFGTRGQEILRERANVDCVPDERRVFRDAAEWPFHAGPILRRHHAAVASGECF